MTSTSRGCSRPLYILCAWALAEVTAFAVTSEGGVRRQVVGSGRSESDEGMAVEHFESARSDTGTSFGVRRQDYGSGHLESEEDAGSALLPFASLADKTSGQSDSDIAKISSLMCGVDEKDPCSQFKKPVHMPLYRGEFGPETVMVVPVAYFLHTCGKLASTRGCGNMSAYYWFSPHHVDDVTCSRTPGDEAIKVGDKPYEKIGCQKEVTNGKLPVAWRPVPYVTHFWKMPLTSTKRYMEAPFQLAIFNKYEQEWGQPPVNFLDLPTIRALAQEFKSACGASARVLYSRSQGRAPGEVNDTQPLQDLVDQNSRRNDFDLMRSQNHVELLEDLYAQWPELSANEIKIRLLTRTQCFIAAQGGGQFPLTFFGGTNIVWKVRGREDKAFYEKTVYQFSEQKVRLLNKNDKHNPATNVLDSFRELMLAHGCAACARRANPPANSRF